MIELNHNWGVEKYELGNAYVHIANKLLRAPCAYLRGMTAGISRRTKPKSARYA